MKKTVKRYQAGGGAGSKTKSQRKSASSYVKKPGEKGVSKKNLRWNGGNTGIKVPAYKVNETGTPKPKYEKELKEKHKLKSGGSVKSRSVKKTSKK